MTQLFNVSIDGVMENIEKCNISEEMNRFYSVATFEMQDEPKTEAIVIINFGDRTFTGFVYSTSKISKLLYRVECRTEGAKLTEPYSAYTESFEDATTSHALCSLYASETGIAINITAGNLDFGGSFERRGTMLSALSNISAVTGAEYWYDGSSLQIQPNKAITEDGTEIPPGDIFDFVQTDKSVYNKGVGFLTIRNGGSETNDIISKNKIYAEVEECSGDIYVYPNPNGTIEQSFGLSALTSIKIERSEVKSVLDKDVVDLDAAIESISSVTLNGVAISDYDFEQGHNVIYFTTLKRGTLKVEYIAFGYKGTTNIERTPIGRFVAFDIFYLNQALRFQGFLLCAGSEASGSEANINKTTDGDMTIIVPDVMRYPKGFDIYTIGGDPQISFYCDESEIVRSVTSVSADYTSVESAKLVNNEGVYRYKTIYPVGSALEARSAGASVSYSIVTEGDDSYFEFTGYYPLLKVSYTTASIKHTIQFANIACVVTMLVKNNNTGKVNEYQLEGIDYDDMKSIPCAFDQYVPVDVAYRLNLPVSEVRGEVLSYTRPDLTTGSVTVDSFGIAKIWVTMDGKYIIDTSSLEPRSTITLTSSVLG